MRRRRREEDLREHLFRCQLKAPQATPSSATSSVMRRQVSSSPKQPLVTTSWLRPLLLLALLSAPEVHLASSSPNSALKFDPETNSYSGLTFTFDPRLGKRVEWLHFEHWLSIVQQSSALLYEALNGRAHLAEVRVLIPYKWRQFEWPVLHKPGVPIIANRRLRYADSDIVVGFEDNVYKETPFAVQHDECSKQGLHIKMPISFLEQSNAANQRQPADVRLKARQLVREFASHRFGIFKESGFRNDYMYPPFVSLAGFGVGTSGARRPLSASANRSLIAQATALILDNVDQLNLSNQTGRQVEGQQRNVAGNNLRGFDENWNECSFETTPANGLPTTQSAACLPYLARSASGANEIAAAQQQQHSFNLMSTDPFSYVDLSSAGSRPSVTGTQPLEWRDLADLARWHFCGDNFALPSGNLIGSISDGQTAANGPSGGANAINLVEAPRLQRQSFAHNQLAANKQNVMCQERSAMEVIKSSDDFRRAPFRLPATAFKFFQEMPPRLILCVEYAAHLYQSRRLDHGILEAAIAKFLAYDLIADTELALVLFGQHHSTRNPFKRLDSSADSRLTLYNPPIDPFDEPARLYTDQELANLDIHLDQTAANGGDEKRLIKGSCSFAKAISEAVSLQQQRSHYDDVGADIVMVTSGLFVEEEAKLEDIIRNYYLRPDSAQLNIIIYPSTMLFDTKSRDGSVVLDSQQSEIIVRSRLSKLLLIQRLTGAKVHLVKEHLDANGDVRMSTLVQFYQIFEHIARGHSWDQTHSMALLGQQTVETTRQVQPTGGAPKLTLNFQFDLDSSIQNELIVAFIDPKQHQPRSSGKRFSIRNLQLRSPGGRLVLTDSLHPSQSNLAAQSAQLEGGSQHWPSTSNEAPAGELNASEPPNSIAANAASDLSSEAAIFPYRSQLGLAGFHLKAQHLNGSHSLAGRWTLSALTDEPIQTTALAMARVNPAGDTVTAHCWIQTYYIDHPTESRQLKQVKVFAQTQAGAHLGPVTELQARMEVQDELGNIVQNVQMLDDGLGAPDMTRGDGIHSQSVLRAAKSGFYKVMVEVSGPPLASAGSDELPAAFVVQSRPNSIGQRANSSPGQDTACCGSVVPPSQQADTRYLSRQLYCGTFFADANNRLSQQRPPRISNLTVANVDQENRRVTLRWFEPQVDISSSTARQVQTESGEFGALHAMDSHIGSEPVGEPMALSAAPSKRAATRPLADEEIEEERRDIDLVFDSISASQTAQQNHRQSNAIRGVAFNGKSTGSGGAISDANNAGQARYEIKMFTDRDAIKRAFDAKQEVGFRFNQWNSEGAFPNASLFGGQKEVTLRIPNGREGIYYVAMKLYNSAGLASHLSTIVSFWIRNNLTLEEAQSIYGPSMTSVDADGNVYDKNGERIGSSQLNSYSILRGTNSLDGISILVFICVLAFILSIVCISLVACLASSARKSFGKQRTHHHHHHDDDKKAAQSAIIGSQTGSGSSMVSGCGSSQQSEVASSVSGSQVDGGIGGGHDVELSNGKFCGSSSSANELIDSKHNTIHYNHLQQQQHYQQQQAQLIQAQHKLAIGKTQVSRGGSHQLEEQQKLEQQQYSDAIYQRQMQQLNSLAEFGNDSQLVGANQAQWPPVTSAGNSMMPQHTMINGYAYATVNGATMSNHLIGHSDGLSNGPIEGNLNQNGLGVAMSPVQSWPADILISHYDKVKQARERNEAPPVMRIETLESGQSSYGETGLPTVSASDEQVRFNQGTVDAQSYLVRQQRNQMPSYFNQQLQQQLSSVLRNKQRSAIHQTDEDDHTENNPAGRSSPALDGVTDHLSQEGLGQPINYGPLDRHQLGQIQPPPQYVYCADEAGQQQALLTEPSIYSQVTNLQQVSSADTSSMGAYYANQWQPPGSNGNAAGQSSGALYPNQQQYQQDYAQALDKCNSAISEV